MLQLRWTLLILGALFLAGLALWESVRGRQARQADLGRLAGSDPAARDRTRDLERERALDLDDAVLPSFSARDPERERADAPLPVYEIPPESQPTGRRLDPILDFGAELPAADESEPVILEESMAAQVPPLQAVPAAPPEVPAEPVTLAGGDAKATTLLEDDFEIGPVRILDSPAAEPAAWSTPADEVPAVVAVQTAAAPVLLPQVASPIVEWPDPEHSQVLSVRILAQREKFQGRAVRLALTAQGFLPGRFALYHKPAEDGRAVLSVASLTKPGTFDDPPRGDMQRFSGLNLFTVLPGPLPAAEAVEELLHAAQTLAARLQARLTDDQGVPLSPSRAQELRDMATAQAS